MCRNMYSVDCSCDFSWLVESVTGVRWESWCVLAMKHPGGMAGAKVGSRRWKWGILAKWKELKHNQVVLGYCMQVEQNSWNQSGFGLGVTGCSV